MSDQAPDYLIIGSGIAGLRAAAALAPAGRVLVLTKAEPHAGSTGYAQGGIAAAIGAGDSPDQHAADTIAASDGLTDQAVVHAMVEAAPAAVQELIDWGAAFDRLPDGRIDLAREGAHSRRRVLHARDATGREIGRVLFDYVHRQPGIRIDAHAQVVQLIVERGAVTGARVLDTRGRLQEARAGATLLATGGAGQVFADTTNPPVAAGDGVALAFLAGARVVDLEFVQFHPTALAVDGQPRFLLSEALRGEGARLVNADGEAFMSRYHPAGDLAPRDRVARAMLEEAARAGDDVALSLAGLDPVVMRERFPLVDSLCRRAGLDMTRDALPVRPAAHYLMGGVETDLDGRTSLPGLFAAGEVASTGVHGANRLASNSLLEGLVFGARAGRTMAAWAGEGWRRDATIGIEMPPPAGAPQKLDGLDEATLRRIMSAGAGVFRSRDGLAGVLRTLQPAWTEVEEAVSNGRSFDAEGWRLVCLTTVARLVAAAALRREESRGAHARTDFPERDDLHWNRRAYDTRR